RRRLRRDRLSARPLQRLDEGLRPPLLSDLQSLQGLASADKTRLQRIVQRGDLIQRPPLGELGVAQLRTLPFEKMDRLPSVGLRFGKLFGSEVDVRPGVQGEGPSERLSLRVGDGESRARKLQGTGG